MMTDAVFLVDTHCHLDLEQFDPDRDAVIERAATVGVDLLVNPGIDVAHSRAATALAESQACVYAAVGVHPNSSADFSDETLAAVRALAAHSKAVAIGEIGLDYYWKSVEPPAQAAAFEAQLTLAAELGLPVIIHNRDADDDVAAILRSWVKSEQFRASALARRPLPGCCMPSAANQSWRRKRMSGDLW